MGALTDRSSLRVRTLAATAFLALAVPALAGASARGETRRLVPGTIHVVVFEPTNGYFVTHNQLMDNGIDVAVDELNGKGGIGGKVRVALERVRFRASSRPARLMHAVPQGTEVAILPCNVDLAAALAKAAAARRLLLLSPCNPDPAATRRIPMDWPTAMSGNQEAAQLVDWALGERMEPAYLLVGEPKTSYVSALTRYFRAALKQDHVPLVGEGTVKLDGSNVSAVAKDIRRAKPLVILTAVFSPYVEKIAAGLRHRGVRAPILVSDGMDAQLELQKYSWRDLSEVLFASFGFARPSSKAFFDDYKARFRKRPVGAFPGLGLETIRVLEAAVLEAGSTAPRAIDGAFDKGFKLTGVGLSDKTYPGSGVREPITDVGISRVDAPPGLYYPYYSSIPRSIPRP